MAEFVGQLSARPLSEWHEDHGPALWWHFPIAEPPYVGTPNDADWDDSGFHTHWTPIPIPPKPWPSDNGSSAEGGR